MANWGVKATKLGEDIASGDMEDYNLWSKYAVGKIATEASGSDTSGTDVNIDYSSHAGQDAIWIPYVSDDNTSWYIGGKSSGEGYGYGDLSVNDFYISLDGSGGGTDYYYYFVIEDSLL